MNINSLLPKTERRKPCCKNRKVPWMPGTLDTTYRENFVEKEIPRESPRPREPQLKDPSLPFDGTTTMKTDYRPFQVPREGPIRPANTIVKDNVPFSGESMYKGDFGPKEAKYERVRPMNAYQPNPEPFDAPMPRSVRPPQAQDPPAPFDGTTTNKADFIPYQIPAPGARAARPQPALQVEKLPFQGQSTYRDTFIPGDAPYRRVKPDNTYQPNPARFDDTTTNKATYVPFSVPATRGPIAPQSALDKEKHPFEGQSTYKDDFRKMPGGLRAERKIAQGGQFESGPFDGTTTYRKDYDQKEIPRQPARRPDEDCESCDSDPNCID
ncbi:hypothetical protein DUNSADRAFT_10115 [Dunaliella salina]|uniref:Encoded protein n=1 Tax=Dunaliella salina TaxID=3046 RepID=A0ABQ7H508_DUNSA|nr:hypothetical protein DUNSADRAFT_10115 [Dunaliella salina]|eukprot:KAF5841944.1 hypothetical protein DUNSADRAFT_10115 [Dunaliella salina]